MLRGLLEMAMGSSSTSDSHPTKGSSSTSGRSTKADLADAGAKKQPPHDTEELAVVPATDAATILHAASAAPECGQPPETASEPEKVETSETRGDRIDKLAKLAADFIRQKKDVAAKKKAGKKKEKNKKPAGGDEENDEDDEEHEEYVEDEEK